ncbi:MAG TPA: NfeD family protein, partial [Planctomycetia bacterium]|nr:NfeD family protein [Planctomycetia bacterium]
SMNRPASLSGARNFVRRQLRQALDRGCTLLLVEIDASSGEEEAAETIARDLAEFPARKVAFVPREATGPATLLLFGCTELVVGPRAKIGGYRPSEGNLQLRADAIVNVAAKSRIPEAFIRRLVDPNLQVYEVRNKQNRNLVEYRTDKQLAEPDVVANWEKTRPGAVEDKGAILTLDSERMIATGVAIDRADAIEQVYKRYGIAGDVPVLKPGWIDSLVEVLTSQGGTTFLLVGGMLLLYLEMSFPGFILPAVLSGICFVLFFWSRWLADLAGSLEIVLFVLGILLLGLELFVIPGFGVTGVIGLALMLSSLVLASQSFTLPSTEAEVWQMAGGVGRVFLAFAIAVGLLAVFGRYLPKLPLFNRFVLSPPQGDGFDAEGAETEDAPLSELVGVQGVADTPLRPAGRIRIRDEEFLDVVAQGDFIEAGDPVEIIEVNRHRIVVRAV